MTRARYHAILWIGVFDPDSRHRWRHTSSLLVTGISALIAGPAFSSDRTHGGDGERLAEGDGETLGAQPFENRC
jgi:hypothetical protein